MGLTSLRRVAAWTAAVVTAAVLLAWPAGGGAQPRQMGGVGITVFVDVFYRGQSATFREDVPDLGEFRLAGRTSSLQVAPGEAWEVCEQAEYRGRCQVFSEVEPDLRQHGWNDRVRSMRRVRGGGYYPPGPGYPQPGYPQPGPGYPANAGIVLFSETNFQGDTRGFDREVTDLQEYGFNDRARSVRVLWGTWEICRDNYFRNCRLISGDESNLDRYNLSRRLSSLRPARGGSGPGGGWGGGGWRPPVGQVSLTLYDSRNFRGRSQTFSDSAATVGGMANRSESLRVSGRWQVCDGVSFSGRCVEVSQDVADLRRLGLHNRIASARPIGPVPY